jgi:bile acid:Na+ symporter, BASS family
MGILSAIGLVFQVSIVITVFGYGLGARTDDVAYVVRRPRILVVSLLAMFVVMPVVALALELYLDLPFGTRVALVAIAVSPVPQLFSRTARESGGRVSYAYGLGFAASVASIVLVPVLVDFVGRVRDRPLGLPLTTVAGTVLLTVLLPLAVGQLVHRLLPRVADWIRETVMRAGNLLLLLACVAVLIVVLPTIMRGLDLPTLVAVVVFIAAGLAVGHFLGGPEPDDSIVLAIACATRNPGLAIPIAAANFPNENVVVAILLYAIIGGTVQKPYVNWQKRRMAAGQQTDQKAES